MATRYVKDANQELGSAYDPAQAAVTGQIPQIQALYDMLGASLQQAQTTGTQEVVNSAERRGVSRGTLEGQVYDSLGQEAALGQAQLGAQRLADIAQNRGSLTQLATNRAGDAASIGGQLQEGSINKRKAALDKKLDIGEFKLSIKKLERMSKLEIQKLERNNEISIQRQRTQATEAAASQAAASGTGQYTPQPEAYVRGRDPKTGNTLFGFVDAGGNAISAARYAQLTGQPVTKVLYNMGKNGDKYAQQVYNQLKIAKPIMNKKLLNRTKKAYSPLFWGT